MYCVLEGAVFKDRRISSDRACGTVVAYDNTNIRIWGMAKRQGIGTIIIQTIIYCMERDKKSVLLSWIQGHRLRKDLLWHSLSHAVCFEKKNELIINVAKSCDVKIKN